jgi:hypothetical protein
MANLDSRRAVRSLSPPVSRLRPDAFLLADGIFPGTPRVGFNELA